jgi:hypothetical protein
VPKTGEAMMGKAKPTVPFTGLWHIVSMDTWDENHFNDEKRRPKRK